MSALALLYNLVRMLAAALIVGVGFVMLLVGVLLRPARRPVRPPGLPEAALRAYFTDARNVAHRHINALIAEAGPWADYSSLDWGMAEYRWERPRMHVIVATRDEIVTEVALRDPADPQRATTVAWTSAGPDDVA